MRCLVRLFACCVRSFWRTNFITTSPASVKIMGCAASKADPASLEKALRDAMRPFDGTWTDSDVATLQTAIAQAEAAFPPEGSSLQATLNEAKEVLRSAAFDMLEKALDMFMKKVGMSLDQVKQATELHWVSKEINNSDCKVIAHLIEIGALASLERLILEFNEISADGIRELADACAGGALANLTHLRLGENKIGDIGLEALAKAITPDKDGKGALGNLKVRWHPHTLVPIP